MTEMPEMVRVIHVLLGIAWHGMTPVNGPTVRAEGMPMVTLLKYREAAERIHASESTARRLGRAGKLDERRISNGCVRVTEESVDKLIAGGYTAPELQETA